MQLAQMACKMYMQLTVKELCHLRFPYMGIFLFCNILQGLDQVRSGILLLDA